MAALELVIGTLVGLIQFLTAVFTGDWEGAWDAIHLRRIFFKRLQCRFRPRKKIFTSTFVKTMKGMSTA